MEKKSTHEIGVGEEERAQRYLEERGYNLIEKNFRWKGGEIDLILRAPTGELVFAEVRSSKSASPWLRLSVGAAKQKRLKNTAMTYALRRNWARNLPKRFDLLWIEGSKVEHWRNVVFDLNF